MGFWSAALPVLGSIGGALINSSSQRKTNAANANLNRVNRKWQAAETRAAEKRAWSRQKRSTTQARNFALRTSDPEFIRRRAENAGFNPLMFLGAGGLGDVTGPQVGQSSVGAPAFAPMQSAQVGSLIAEGFAGAADQINQSEQLALQESALQMENDRLAELAAKSRFQPKMPGIYQQGETPLLSRLSEGPIKGHTDGEAPPRNPIHTPPKDQPQVQVWTPWGVPFQITESEAEQSMLRPGATVSQGMMAELGGEAAELLAVWHGDSVYGRFGLKPLKKAEGDGWQWPWQGKSDDAPVFGAQQEWDGRNDWWSREQRKIGIQ